MESKYNSLFDPTNGVLVPRPNVKSLQSPLPLVSPVNEDIMFLGEKTQNMGRLNGREGECVYTQSNHIYKFIILAHIVSMKK